MNVLGISPLDKDATASLVVDGRIVFAAGEERFSRQKQHSGFPRLATRAALEFAGLEPGDIDAVAYGFLTWDQEAKHIAKSFQDEAALNTKHDASGLGRLLSAAKARVPERTEPVHGLPHPNQRMEKGLAKEVFYRLTGTTALGSKRAAKRFSEDWERRAVEDHRKWQHELEAGLAELGLEGKLKRLEHHSTHAANSYHMSGFDRALVVTIDGYGTGLAGSISLGEGGTIKRLHSLRFPYSLGTFYETVTSSLGFKPDRHAGKIVGLAAYGDPSILSDVLMTRVEETPGDFKLVQNLNVYFSRHLASHFPMIDVAAAYQHVLEQLATRLIAHWVKETGVENVVLSGGVTANVKMNQRIHEVDGVRGLYVYPNMGDGGCGSGAAMQLSWPGGVGEPFETAYLGPEFTREEMLAEIEKAGLPYEEPENLAAALAAEIHGGSIVARFDGRMEYGPRALGNRSILYHGRDPGVNQWLNQRLGRTEFMPFAPVTLWEDRERCYLNLDGAEYTAQFMTVTFDCTDFMLESCPAAVHVDRTARPQLIRREMNPGYYDILAEHKKLSGSPSLINTSFNMHEEPIVCTPSDAIRAFLLGHLEILAMGPFLVRRPE
ncbi:MAG: carbamoyltransferase C-terminal domain-containing protein [Planctomycetota bacterium]